MLLGILKRLGLRAEAVANGAEAVKLLETTPYDLVLMDVQMPVMDGLAAVRAIRDPKSPVRNRAVPIIAVTAHATWEDRKLCAEAGMDDYISKPVAADDARRTDREVALDPASLGSPGRRSLSILLFAPPATGSMPDRGENRTDSIPFSAWPARRFLA